MGVYPSNGGRVGIGTTSPSQKLEVSEGYILASGSGTSHGFELQRTGLDTYQLRHLDGGLTVFNSTDSRKEMTFDGAGNVGIGTTSPGGILDVDGTYGDLIIGDPSIGSRITYSDTTRILLNSNNILFYTDSLQERMRINAAGNVGIGTTSPSEKLHVDGSIRIADVIYDSSNSPGTAGQVLYKPTNDTIGWVNRDSITSVPTSITATPGGSLSLASNIDFVYFTWSGGSGTYTLNLPSASSNTYRIIRFVCDSTVSANDKIHVQGSGSDTVDGGLFYTLNKPYNGVQVWSDGSEWIVIQAKAT